MTWAVIRALLSHWRRRPFQLVTLLLGLSLATGLWSGVQAINAEARKSYGEAADILGGGGLTELVRQDGAPILPQTFVAIRRGGWLVSPVVDGWIEADRGRVRVLGVDPFSMPAGTPAAMAIAPQDLTTMLGRNGVLMADPVTATRLTGLGERLQTGEGIAPGLLLADIEAAAELVGQVGYDRLLLDPKQPLRQTPLNEIAPELQRRAPETAEDLGRLTDSFHLNLTAFGLLSFAVGLFIVNGSVGLAFEQRRPVFRTLRALGVTARRLVWLLTLELLAIALVAGVIGIFMGYLIAAALLPDVAATLRGLYGASVDGALTLSPLWWLSGIAIACLGTALAAASGLIRVARMPLLAPAKPRAWAMATGSAMRWQLALAGHSLVVALIGFAFGELIGGFILLGGFLIAAALALPSVLAVLIVAVARLAKGPVATWFWADTRQQLPGLSLALMALLLALSANIGVGTMVASFRTTFTGWLDQRLVSDLYVTLENTADTPALMAFLETRSEAVLPIWHVDAEVLGGPAEIYGVVDHPIYSENWPLLAANPDVWEQIAVGEGALINEQLSRREGLAPGDPLLLPGGWETTVTGVYSDYGNPIGQVVIPLPVLIDRYPQADKTDFGVLVDGDTEPLKRALSEDFGLPVENLVDQAALKAFSLSIFERTFAVTGALNILTLAVAGIAILTSLLTLASMRLPQLAPVWALGITRKTLGRIELIRAVVLAGFTFVLAVPVGLGLAWVLLAIINVEAFGWRLPMHLFPRDWLWLAVLSLAAAGLASLWPARQLAKRPPADLMRVFTHER
ncbi:MAG: ABC transporter permease [Silicimonas sp.]|nr:ABC transporter permease [Silicimonas sp.]